MFILYKFIANFNSIYVYFIVPFCKRKVKCIMCIVAMRIAHKKTLHLLRSDIILNIPITQHTPDERDMKNANQL